MYRPISQIENLVFNGGSSTFNLYYLWKVLGYIHTVPNRYLPVSKVAPIQCEQELMFCCRAEIVPKRSQCEYKPYPSYNLQRFLLISKDYLPVRDSVAISAPIKCSDLSRTVSKIYPIRKVPLSTAERSSVLSVNISPIRYIFCDALFHCPVQCEHSLSDLRGKVSR